jgi:hypothetical protein
MNRFALKSTLVLLAVCLAGCSDPAEDNRPPELSPVPSEVRVLVGETVDLTVTATDPDGDDITITLETAPEGAEFISPGGLGRFHWSPIVSDAAGGGQAHEVVFVASDGKGGKDSTRVTIEVSASDGAPRFVTGGQTVLDLGQTDTLEVEIAVKDDDSARVSIELAEAPKGMQLRPTGDKSSLLIWTPTDEQIQTKPVWGAILVADDGTSGPVTQELSVILISKSGCDETAGCGCQVPRILHDEIPDQRGVEDYHVLATIKDDESEIQRATLFWTDGDPGDRAAFNAVPMTTESGSDWVAPIPNPLLERGDSTQIFYFVCAQDNDDAEGTACDNLMCEPAETSWSFTAYAPGDEGCADDRDEPNNSAAEATFLPEDSVIEGLTICPGDEDWFTLELGEDEAVDVLMAHTQINGDLDLEVYASDRETRIDQSATTLNDEIVSVETGVAGKYYFRVFGQPNSYDLLYFIRDIGDAECTDEFEPNDTIGAATPLEPGVYDDLRICEGDVDSFSFELVPGDVLTFSVAFAHDDGDLDVNLVDEEGTVLARSITATDNEEIVFREVESVGTYTFQVLGFLDASAEYDLTVSIDFEVGECRDDDNEPDGSIADATHLDPFVEVAAVLCSDDIDVWSFDLSRGQRGRVHILFDGDSTDLDLGLFNADEVELDSSDGVTNTESAAWTARTDMTAYPVVVGYEDDSGPYTISVEICENDDSDPNDDLDDADAFEGESLDGRILCLGETDWYLVEVFGGQENTFAIETADADEVQVELTDDRGVEVARGQRTDGAVEVTLDADAGDLLLLRVQSNRPSGQPIDYTLRRR